MNRGMSCTGSTYAHLFIALEAAESDGGRVCVSVCVRVCVLSIP